MKALTVQQPWAWSIAEKFKQVENRTWKPPPALIGQTIAIHASARSPDGQAENFLTDELGVTTPEEYDVGAVLCLVRLSGVVSDARSLNKRQRLLFIGPWGWVLDRVVKIPEPVCCKGQLGLWTVPELVLKDIQEQLR